MVIYKFCNLITKSVTQILSSGLSNQWPAVPATPLGSVHKSRDDNVVHMWV